MCVRARARVWCVSGACARAFCSYQLPIDRLCGCYVMNIDTSVTILTNISYGGGGGGDAAAAEDDNEDDD